MKSPVRDASLARSASFYLAPRDPAYRASIVLLMRKKITAAATALIIVSSQAKCGAMHHKLISPGDHRA